MATTAPRTAPGRLRQGLQAIRADPLASSVKTVLLTVAGEKTALTEQEQRGLALFVNTGCASCHGGPALGGTMYTPLGAMEPYTTNDLGRYNVTQKEGDKHAFKVPGLRNIAVTGPYLHDGSVPTLEAMVQLMSRHQLGKKLTADQLDDIVTFLRALTGELPSDYTVQPELPPSPKPATP